MEAARRSGCEAVCRMIGPSAFSLFVVGLLDDSLLSGSRRHGGVAAAG